MPERLRAWLRGPPEPLAALRIALGLVWLTLAEVHGAVAYASSIDATTIFGLPLPPAAAELARVVLLGAAAAGLVGLRARTASAIVTIAALYLLGAPQDGTQPPHTHHLVWLSALLAVSPSADAWSLPALRAPVPPVRVDALAYGVPTLIARTLIGLVYFFPGVWKLMSDDWTSGVALTEHVLWKQAMDPELAAGPLAGLLTSRSLATDLSILVICFELSFVVLVQQRHLRLLAFLMALVFHAAIAMAMDIHFSALWLTFVIFVDLPAAPPLHGEPSGRWWPAAVMGLVLMVGVVIAGALGATKAWPFACYPTFHERPGPTLITVFVAHGDAPPAFVAWGGYQGLAWRVVALPDGPQRHAACESLAALALPQTSTSLTFYRAEIDVAPALRDTPRIGPALCMVRR